MINITLLGDSIFDNGRYVARGRSLSELLAIELGSKDKVALLAVDGDITTDISKQLLHFPPATTHAFLSCGGNDALLVADVLNNKSSSVGESLQILSEIVNTFRINYRNMLQQILMHTAHLTVCTI